MTRRTTWASLPVRAAPLVLAALTVLPSVGGAAQAEHEAWLRTHYDKTEHMAPGEVTAIRINLRDRFHTFKAGHRIMVHVQSSWFPAYDRNPQTFTDIYHARPEEYHAATQTVYRSARHPSHLVLGVLR